MAKLHYIDLVDYSYHTLCSLLRQYYYYDDYDYYLLPTTATIVTTTIYTIYIMGYYRSGY